MGIKMCIIEAHPLPSVVKYFYDFLGGIWTDCSPGEWNLGQLLPEQTVAMQPWLPLQSDSSTILDSSGTAPSRGASFCFDLFNLAVSHFFYYVTNYGPVARKDGSIYRGLREPTYKDALLGLYVLT